MSFSIEGKTAIVTGAANGIGLAIARHFAAQGANVMCADMDEDRLAKEHQAAADLPNANIAYFGADLRKKLSIANLLSATIDAFDRVDILVNASRQVLLSDPLKVSEDNVAQLIDQNLMTSLRLTQQVAKWMIKNSPKDREPGETIGSIINLSSIAARRAQLAPEGVRVNAVAFGSVLSASLEHMLIENPAHRDAIIDKTPLARVASSDEVAETAQYLASDGSRFVTGQILTVDGGRTLLDPVDGPSH